MNDSHHHHQQGDQQPPSSSAGNHHTGENNNNNNYDQQQQNIGGGDNNNITQQDQQQQRVPNPNRPRRILMMGPNDGGKTSMAKVIFENWEPARTQYQGKTSGQVREEIFLFGRKMFTFFDCGGQVSYFDDYLKDPYLFNDVAALVFVVDATLFFLSGAQDDVNTTSFQQQQQQQYYGNSGGAGGSSSSRTWNPQTIRDIFAKIIKTLLDRSPGARVFIMLNKMDKVYTTALEESQINNILNEQGKKLQRVAYDGIFTHRREQQQMQQQRRQMQQQQDDPSSSEYQQTDGGNATTTAMHSSTNNGNNESSENIVDNNNTTQQQEDSSSSPSSSVSVFELERTIPLFKTSIFNHTIIHAWSQVITRLIEPSSALRALREWLGRIRESADGEILEAALMDSSTMLCVASSSAFFKDDDYYNNPLFDNHDGAGGIGGIDGDSSSAENRNHHQASSSNSNHNNKNTNNNNNLSYTSQSFPISSEVAIRAKRQRLKGLEFVSITHSSYNMTWRTCIPDTLQLLLVGDGCKTSAGVTQHNAETLVEWFNETFVDENNSKFPPPWPVDVVQVRQLLGTL